MCFKCHRCPTEFCIGCSGLFKKVLVGNVALVLCMIFSGLYQVLVMSGQRVSCSSPS